VDFRLFSKPSKLLIGIKKRAIKKLQEL